MSCIEEFEIWSNIIDYRHRLGPDVHFGSTEIPNTIISADV